MTRPSPTMTIRALGLGLALTVSLLLPASSAYAEGQAVSISDASYVPADKVHEGDLVSVMGDVRVDGKVTGSIVVVLGTVTLNGQVDGDVISIMTRTELTEAARVDGQFVNVGWTPMRAAGSRVGGEIVNVNFMNLLPFTGHGGGIGGLLRFLFILRLIQLAMLFVILIVITSLMPRRLAVMAQAFPAKWGWSFLVGLLTYVGVWIGVLFLAVTLIGLPLALVLWFVAKAVKWLGLAALLYLFGQTVGQNLFRRQLPHLSCVLAGFVPFAIFTMFPLIGWGFSLVISILAVGLAITTRFGSEPAVAGAADAPTPTAPPAWAATPASGASTIGPDPGTSA